MSNRTRLLLSCALLAAASSPNVHAQAGIAYEACRAVGTGTPDHPVAVLVDETHRLRLGPIDLGTVAPPPAAVARASAASAASATTGGAAQADGALDTGFHILVAPTSADPDDVPNAPRTVALREEPSECPGARRFRVVLVWGDTTEAEAAAARAPGRFELPLPNFSFVVRDDHDHGSRALYTFDARVLGTVSPSGR